MTDAHYTLIAVPYRDNVDMDRLKQYDNLKTALGTLGPAARPFNMPNLKLGTLDSLLEASDELHKIDPQLESQCFKLANLLEEVSGVEREKALELRGATQDGKMDVYLKDWCWDASAYNPKENIAELLRKFQHVASGADDRIRPALTEFTELNKRLDSVKRRSQGSFLTRPIADAVKKWCAESRVDSPLESEFLVTIFVAVPNEQQQDWVAKYAALNSFVVPQASSVVARDDECVLNSLVCFKRAVEDVKVACRKAKWTVREMNSSDDITATEFHRLEKKNNEDKTKLKLLLSQQFTACYVAWIHLKCVRLFVEALLRFGLPPRFVPIVVAASMHQEETILAKLSAMYADYVNKYQKAEEGMIHESGALHHEYPFVCLKVANLLHTR